MSDIKKMYSTILGDSFPISMTISFGGHQLIYRKKTWNSRMEDGTSEERGVSYGVFGSGGRPLRTDQRQPDPGRLQIH